MDFDPITILYAVLMFCILIIFHELGHFGTAKLFSVKVNQFALGMGPVLLKKQKGETEYSLRLFPIGGFCAMEGEDEDSEDDRAFNKKKPWQKAVIVTAGSLMNLLLAILLMIIVMFYIGSATTTIDQVVDKSPAMEAGLLSGDRIVALDGVAMKSWDDVSDTLEDWDKDRISVTVERNGSEVVLESGFTTEDDGRKIIGIIPALEHNPIRAVGDGLSATVEMGTLMLDILRQIFTGEVSVKELSGPVGIVYMTGVTASLGIVNFLYFMALLSLNLAIFNMLPLPALDGGRLIFILVRKVTGRVITDEIEGKIHFIGILLLFALMIYVTWNDIGRFILPFFK